MQPIEKLESKRKEPSITNEIDKILIKVNELVDRVNKLGRDYSREARKPTP